MLSKARAGSQSHRDELNRILDPSYTSSSHIASPTYMPYTDAQGHLHDPDYRHFPLIQPSSHYSAKRRGTKSSNRPHWELVDEEASLLADDDDALLQEDSDGYYAKRNSWSVKPTTTSASPRHYSPSRRSSYPPRSNAYSGAILSPADVSPPTSWSSSSAYSQSSSPASTSSSVLQQQRGSPFEAGSGSEKSKCRIGRRRRSSAISTERKAKRASNEYDEEWYRRDEGPVAEVEEEAEEDVAPREYPTDDEDEDDEEPRRRVVEEDGDCVPSCMDALRRRWQAFSLSIRFGMFRAERRIKRRVQSLI